MIWLIMTQISRFISEVVPIAQIVTGDGDESALEGGGGFADYALASLYCLQDGGAEVFSHPVLPDFYFSVVVDSKGM